MSSIKPMHVKLLSANVIFFEKTSCVADANCAVPVESKLQV